MVVMSAAAHRLGEIGHVWKLTACRSAAEIRRQLRQLARGCRIAARGCALGGGLQVGGGLLRHLRKIAWVRLLELAGVALLLLLVKPTLCIAVLRADCNRLLERFIDPIGILSAGTAATLA